MKRLFSSCQIIKPCAVAVTLTCAGVSQFAIAGDVPLNIFSEEEMLFWTTTAPSTNIYENGAYIATVHGESSFGPVFDGSVYQLVSHDHGLDFSVLSDPHLVVDNEDDSNEDDENADLEYEEARVYFELNDTDGDLGLHALMDGESWKSLSIKDTTGREIFAVNVTNGLLAQGMTEIFFESSEPQFDELNPVDFFQRFPAGEYEISGETLEGETLESDVELSHVIPAAPGNLMLSGQSLPNDCEDTEGPVVAGPYTISWDPVTHSHAFLGAIGDVEVARYQVVVEREEPSLLHISIDVAGDVTSLNLPGELIGSGEYIKAEVLTIAETGNQSASETCFVSAN